MKPHPFHSILLHMILRACSAFTGNRSSAIRILLVHVVRPLGNHVIVVYVDHVTLLDQLPVALIEIIILIIEVFNIKVIVCIAFTVHQMLAVSSRGLIVPIILGMPPVLWHFMLLLRGNVRLLGFIVAGVNIFMRA